MLHVFFINQVKLVARTLKTTNNKGQREYILTCISNNNMDADTVKVVF